MNNNGVMLKSYVFFISLILLIVSEQVHGQGYYGDTIVLNYSKISPNDNTQKQHVVDTIFPNEIGKHVLIGTTVFKGSRNNNYAMWQGIYLDEVESEDCLREISPQDKFEEGNRIVSFNSKKLEKGRTMFVIRIEIMETCCNDFLCEIEYLNDSTLSLNYLPYGTNCSCTCCYGLNYYIKSALGDDSPKYFMINNDERTIRFYDE